MKIRVIPVAQSLDDLAGDVCVVVDVIRATTALVTMFEAGSSRVFLTKATADPHVLRSAVGGDAVLCAEMADGNAPPGYDLPPSPTALAKLDLRGRVVVLATANGTPAALQAARSGAGVVILGALRNLHAVAEVAAHEALEREAMISVICAGRLRNSRIALEDIYCAGLLVSCVEALADGNRGVELDDSAVVARGLASTYVDAQAALMSSLTGQLFVAAGHGPDVRFCAETDAGHVVPRVVTSTGPNEWPVGLLDD